MDFCPEVRSKSFCMVTVAVFDHSSYYRFYGFFFLPLPLSRSSLLAVNEDYFTILGVKSFPSLFEMLN